MEIKRVCALYFSATGNTEKTVAAFAETLAEQLERPMGRGCRSPSLRSGNGTICLADTDLVVVAYTHLRRESCLTRSCPDLQSPPSW